MDVAYSKIFIWQKMVTELALAKKREMAVRKELVAEFFKDPKLGTNTLVLTDNIKLKYTHKFNESLDEAVLKSVLETMPEGSEDLLIKYEPKLVGSAYKALGDEQKKTFSVAVITKPASPGLKLDIKDVEED